MALALPTAGVQTDLNFYKALTDKRLYCTVHLLNLVNLRIVAFPPV